MDNANPGNGAAGTMLDRRSVVLRLTGTAAAAWVAPSVLSISRASAMAVSGCNSVSNFDDGTLQGWLANGTGPASWQASSLAANSGTGSAWFGNAGTNDSLHPVVGAPSFNGGVSRGTLTSTPLILTSGDGISFDVRLAIEAAGNYDRFRLYVVQGNRRRRIWDKSDGGFSIINHPENPSTEWDLLTTNGAWSTQSITIGNVGGGIDLDDPVQLEFDFQTVDGLYNRTEGIFLDNITLPCNPAALIETSDVRSATRSGLSTGATQNYLPGYVPPPEETAPTRGADSGDSESDSGF